MRKFLSLLAVLILYGVLAFAQTSSVSGTVKDETGTPVPFATINENGTRNTTVADVSGKFTLKLKGQGQLTISAAGFQPKTVSSTSDLQNISLVRGQGQLTEVVVTALQTRRNKNEVVYANQTVRNEELNSVVNKSALNALQGKVAGVKISSASGAVGASTRVVLRGETSLTQGNNALIVVDGVPINNSSAFGGGGTGNLSNGAQGDRDFYTDFGNRANDINPDDIESLTVLKGPSATSLYGSRGSAGVILITTKRGKPGKGKPYKINVGSSYSQERAYIMTKRQSQWGSGYASCGGCGGGIDINMGENFSWGKAFDGELRPWTAVPADADGNLLPLTNGKIEQLYRPYSAVKDQLASFFDYGNTNRNTVSIDGGSDKLTYYLSYTNFNNNGIMPGTKLNKNNILFNSTATFSDKISTSFSFNYTKLKQRGAIEGGYAFGYASGASSYSNALQSPVDIPFDEIRDYNSPYHDFNGYYGQYTVNPYFLLGEQKIQNNVDNVIASASINYTPVKNLTFTGRASTNFNNSTVTEAYPKFQYNRALSWLDGVLADDGAANSRDKSEFNIGSYKESASKNEQVNIDVLGNYSKKINDNYKIDATVGFNDLDVKRRVVGTNTVGGLIVPGFYDLSNSVENPQSYGVSSHYRLMGAYANLSFGIKNMLFLDYSARKDWSSTLPEGKRGFFYQSGGFSFVPTNYFDIKNNWLSYLKFRGDIGTSGKDAPLYRLDNYFLFNPLILDYGDGYQITAPFNGQPATVKSARIGNPNLKPELTVTYEGGVDIGLFHDRLNIEYTYYNTNSKNQIVDVNLPWSSGANVTALNIGRMVNKGHELAIKATPVRTKSLDWKVAFTFAKNNNKVISIADEYKLSELVIYQGLVHFSGHGSLNLVAAEGLPFGTYKATDYVYTSDGQLVVNANGTPKQSSNQVYKGSYQPKFLTSFSSDFTVKGVSFYFLLDAKKGGLFYSGTKLSTEFNGTASTTAMNNRENFIIPNSVTDDGSGHYVANTKAISVYNYLAKALPSSAYLIDASYLKLREVSIGYTLSGKMLNHTPFSNANVSLFGKNLKYWVAKENTFADPEVSGVGGASDAVGIETSVTPTQRSFGLELKLTIK
jgi:TonB-linked SusC/RagA family outer membrane protein